MAKDRASSILESARKASGREKKYKTTEKEKEQVSGGQTSTTNTTKKTTDRATSILESARKASGRNNTVGGGRTSYSSASSNNSKPASNAFGSAGSLGTKVGVDAVGQIESKQRETLNLIQRLETAKSKTTDDYYDKRYKEEFDRLTTEHANDFSYPTAAQADSIVLGEMKAAEKEVEDITTQLERLQSGAREANWYDSTIGAVERGYLGMKAGKESYKKMQGHENEADMYNEKLQTEYNTYTDNKAKQVLQFIGEFIGQQAYNLSDPRTLGMALTGAGAAAAAGQAGPQVALPEEIVSVPAGAIVGYTSGASLNTYEVSAGNTYETLKKLGVSDEVARNTSYGTGMVVAVLEAMQLDELVDAYTFGVKSGAADDLLQVIGNEILKRTKNSAVETTEEVLQEIASIGGESLAYGIDKGESLYSWEEIQERLDDTATTSFVGFGAMNVPAAAINTGRAVINKNNVNNNPVNVTQGTTESAVEPQTQKETKTPVNNNATQRTTTNNTNTPTQTTSVDPIEQAAREVVAERTRNSPVVTVETMSINGETITPEDAKKASGYGKHGSELLANAVNKAEGRSFSEVKGDMHIAYMAGYSNQNTNIKTDFEQEAYFAGKKDRIMDNTTAKDKAKTATVYESGVVKNDNFNKLSKASQEVLETLAKDHKMSVEMQDKIVASIVNGVEQRAAGSHFDGKMEGSMATEKPLIEWAIHEDGHRMEQMATDEWNVLANALYERAERLGRRAELGLSQGTRFDKMKADHDRAGITKDTSGYFGEVVMRELETIFASPEAFNAWRAEIEGNAQVKTAWQKFMDFLVELINKAKTTLAQSMMSKEARAQARAEIAELERIKELYANAYKATSKAVTKRANEVQTDTNSSKNLEIKINKEYNGNISYSVEDIADEGYTTEGTKWAIANGLLTRSEQADFWENISELNKSGYYKHRSKSGQYIIDVGRKLVFTNGDFKVTTISSIIEFDENSYEANINDFKEWIINEERDTAQHGESLQIIEIVQGEGYVSEHFPSAYRVDERENGRRKGKDSTETNRRSQKDVSDNRKSYSLEGSFSTDGMTDIEIKDAQDVISSLKTYAMSSRYLDGFASYTEERMSRELADSSANYNLDYANSYITWVSPIDFVYATTTNEQSRQRLSEEAGELNVEKLSKEIQPVHLTVDFETGEITGHEGRHRMLALQKAGIDKVAIVINAINNDRYNTKPIDFMSLKGQKFEKYHKGTDMYLHNMLPLSKRYSDVARELFTNKPKSGVQYSLEDSEGNTLTEAQQEYFKDSKVRDEKGNLLVMYHGTTEDFTVFDKKKARASGTYGRGFYFTRENNHAKHYGEAKAYYLKIDNPLSTKEKTITKNQLKKFLEVIAKDEDYGLDNYGYGSTVESVIDEIYDDYDTSRPEYRKTDFSILQDINATAIGNLVEAVELFNKVNGTNFDGFILPTETVTFNSEQAKLTSNENPTNNPDINFSLEEPIEETKNLIALHNLTEEKLLKTLELGGFPMPSIAVTKKDIPHTNFGNITLVMNKSTIDPQENKNNVVYSADAWTPVFPNVEYEANPEAERRLHNKFYDLVKKFGRDAVEVMYSYGNTLEDSLNRQGGAEGIIERLKDDKRMMNVFLLDTGKNKVEDVYKEKVERLSDSKIKEYDFIINGLGEDVINETYPKEGEAPFSVRKKWLEAHGEELEKVYADYLASLGIARERIPALVEEYNFTAKNLISKVLIPARNYLKNGAENITKEYDSAATQEAIQKAVDTKEYEKWLRENFGDAEKSKGIYNNRDYYTPSGNRRSFEATHYPVTLENIVKAMASQNGGNTKNVSGFVGIKTLRAGTAERFKSIADMHKRSDRLQHVTQEEADAINDALSDRMYDVMNRILEKSKYKADNRYIQMDSVGEILTEVAESGKYTIDNISKIFSKYEYNIGNGIATDIRNLMFDVSQMPVNIFEAKPQRAVGFNEIAAAIIPKSTSDKLKTELKNKGIKTIEYDENKDGDRLEKVNSVPDVSFSLEETNNTSSKDQKQLLDTIEQLKGQFEVTKFAKVDAKKLAKMTRDILKEYDSKADTDETRKAIDELYQYIANGEGQNPAAWNDVYNRAYKIAQNIVENALVTDDYMYQEYKSLRDYLRKTPLKFNSGYDSVPTAYESFNDFRKKNMGRLKFTNDGMSIDSFYQELSSLYPEYFDSEEQTNTADQLERIVDVLDEIQPTEVNPFDGQVQQASMHLANDLINRFFDIPQAKPTFADKAERRVINTRIKAKKQLDRVREQRDIKIEKEKAKRRDSLAKMSEKKKASVLRARIMRHTGELHKTLIKATDQKHIPPELENAVLALLYNINLESNYTYDVYTDSYKKNDKGYPTNKTKAFLALKEMYAEIAKNNDYGLTLASELFDSTGEGVTNIFDEVMALSDKKIADMTSEELTKIYDAIRIVEHSITTANKMFAMKKWEGLSETAKAFEKSVATRRAKHALMKSHLTLDIETPITFFSHFGEAGNELFQAFRDSQDNEQVMIDELAERVQKIVSLEQVQKAEKELFEFTTTEGKKLTLSKAHIMDIYLLYKRKQGKKHLLYDPESEHFGNGIHQPEIKSKHIRRDSESTRLTKADLDNIISKLSDEDKAIADKLQKTTLKLAEWGNKACLDVFGYEKFNDPNYWTIKSAKESINQTPEKNKDIARSIKNMGSAKAVEDKATNALDIDGVFNVFNQHASDMICYSAWLGAMEDATKLYNYTFRDDEGFKTNRTFVSMLDKYAGEGGSKYYFNLMKDIQNGIGLAPDTATERIYTKLFGKMAKAKVAYKATVVAQQPTAIIRASSVINPLSILQAAAKGGVNLPAWAVSKIPKVKVDTSEWYGGWERALKYAPIASRKAIGGYEINSNDSGLKGVLFKPETKKGKVVEAVKESPLWAAGKADEITWGVLWNACEIETSKDKSLEKGSEEYYEAVSKLFTKVINETQVVDGVLQRSQLMRSSSGWIKPLTTFKGEPTMALNGVIRAYDNLRYETDTKKRGKAIKKFSRATTVFLTSAVLTAFARSLAVGGTGEDDEEYWKKVWKSFSGIQGDEKTWFDFVKNIGLKSDAVNNINPLTWLPITSEMMSLMQGYDVERLDVASIGDFMTEAKKFIDSLDKEGKQTVGYSARQVLLKAAEFTGYSPYNLIRDIEGAIRTVRVETNDVKGLYEMEKWRTRPASNVSKYVDILYRAYSTDSDDYEYIYNDMIENGADAEKIKDGMEECMKDAEGVKKVSELTKRYMSPDVEKKYDNSLSKIRTSDVWKKANATQRKEAEADLYNFLTSDSEDMEKAREEAMLNGVDSSEYALWQIAIEMADQPKGEKGSGSYDTKEKAEAINSLNLGEKEMAYFYGRGLNESGKEELNQVMSDGIDIQDYINFKAATSEMTADKRNGKSIPNSKKRKVVNYLNSANLTDEEWNYFYYEIMNYKK